MVESSGLQHNSPRRDGEQSPIQDAPSHPYGHKENARLSETCRITIKDSRTKIEQIVTSSKACQLTNVTRNEENPYSRARGTYWEVDFTEVKPGKYGNKYLLLFVDTFSGWVEAFPTKHETAQVVAKKMLEDIMPRYGFPTLIGSDNGPAFVSKVIQEMAQFVGADGNYIVHIDPRAQAK